MGKTIEKKILPEYYRQVLSHRKTFEIRKDDSDYEVGDVLLLKEWDGEQYTGHQTKREITYILREVPGTKYGLKEGFCILAIQPMGWDGLTTADIKGKRGTWQWKIHGKPESGGTLGEAICDQCGESTYATAVKGDLNFCPNCGAKMEPGW